MELVIDKKIYSEECVAKTVYSLSGKFVIERHNTSATEETLIVTSLDREYTDKEIQLAIYSRLNDYNLRCIIEKETHDIKTLLYAKAFADFDDVDALDMDD